jgi:hypothetical protein
VASPSPAQPAGLLLRASLSQAIPPLNRFSWMPVVAITGDRTVVTGAPVLAIFPGPLVPPLNGRTITEAGLAKIFAAAQDFGLLGGQTDFSGGAKPGQMLGTIELAVGDRVVEIVGNPEATIACVAFPCEAPPATPEAFGAFWQMLQNLPAWIGDAELGPETPWQPQAYSVLIGPAADPQGLPQAPADWPLEMPLATAGGAAGDGVHRCLTIRGDDAARLTPALQAANAITPWIQDPATSATFGLTVRPLLPGEDACRELFGIGG